MADLEREISYGTSNEIMSKIRKYVSQGNVSSEDWFVISRCGHLDDLFINDNAEYLNWHVLVKAQVVSDALLIGFVQFTSWEDWSWIAQVSHYGMTRANVEYLLSTYPQLILWHRFINDDRFDDMLVDNAHLVDWNVLSDHIDTQDEDRLVRLQEHLNWERICPRASAFSVDFLCSVIECIPWHTVFTTQQVSNGFMAFLIFEGRMTEKDFESACGSQRMSEKLYEIIPFRPNWRLICRWQNLSCEYMEQHTDDLVWGAVSEKQRLSPTFYTKFRHMLTDTKNVRSNKNRWERIKPLRLLVDRNAWLLIESFVATEAVDVIVA